MVKAKEKIVLLGKEYFNASKTGEMMDLGRQTVLTLARTHKIRSIIHKGALYICEEWMREYIDNMTRPLKVCRSLR